MTPPRNPRPGESIQFMDCSQIVTLKVHIGLEIEERDDVCGNIAEVFERYYRDSTSGRTYWARTRCLDGHILDVEITHAEWLAGA